MAWMKDHIDYKLIKFGITSASGLLINLTILSFLVEIAGVSESISGLISMSVAPVLVFPAVNNWVFNADLTSNNIIILIQRFTGYYSSIMLSKAVNYFIYLLLISVGGWYIASWVVGSIATFLLTYFINKFVFDNT